MSDLHKGIIVSGLKLMLLKLPLINGKCAGLCYLHGKIVAEIGGSSHRMDLVMDYMWDELPLSPLNFSWNAGEVEPRKKWLEEQIKKLEE